MTVQALSKRIGLPPTKISSIELSKVDLPPENVLISWLQTLGLNKLQTRKIILLSRNFRIQHWIRLNRNESANPDILRLLDVYRQNKLTDFDRTILRVVAR